MKSAWICATGLFWVAALFSQVFQVASSAPAPDYLIQYRIPGAQILHWNYYPSLNYNHKFGPPPPRVPATQDELLPLQTQVIPTATLACTSTTRTITTTPQATPTPSPSSTFGNDNEPEPSAGHKEGDEYLTEGFLDWLEKNPDPTQQQAAVIKPDDQDEFPVLEPESEESDFAFLDVPSRGVKCPPGQRFVDGVCRRQSNFKLRPRPQP